jgi:phospholipase/carboxylesterase
MTSKNLQTIELDTVGAPARATVVMLHGLGADGTDFLPMADEMDLSSVGPVRWILPRAPVRPVTVNNGYRMRAWYDILGSDFGAASFGERPEDEAGLRESFALVHRLVEREVERGVPSERIVLAGFSQGCAITLGAGLRSARKLAGLAGLSGYLPLAGTAAAERNAANAGAPVFMAHGKRDAVVPFAGGEAARDALQALGHAVEWHDYPMEHSVCIEEMQALEGWLKRALA